MLKILAFLLALTLAGCACSEHRTACMVGGAIIVGSVAASFHHDDQRGPPAMSSVAGPNCNNGACR